jgi:hypothetical protein
MTDGNKERTGKKGRKKRTDEVHRLERILRTLNHRPEQDLKRVRPVEVVESSVVANEGFEEDVELVKAGEVAGGSTIGFEFLINAVLEGGGLRSRGDKG